MGLYDRSYARQDAGSARPGAKRAPSGRIAALFDRIGWSVTTWMIIVNVAVFVLGFALQPRPSVPMALGAPEVLQGVPTEVVLRARVDTSAPRDIAGRQGFAIVDPQTRQLIGRQPVDFVRAEFFWGHFSTARGFFGLEVWRLVTFQFLHVGWLHLLLNMMGLVVFGREVEEFLGRRRYLALYLTCGVFGALLFLLLNLLGNTLGQAWRVPGLLFDDIRTPLVGASAGIFGIILAAAYVAPQRVIDILGIIPIKQRPAAYGLLVIAAVQLFAGSSNAGGEAAHIGGALAGYYFIRRMYLLRDFFEVLGEEPTPPPSPGQSGKGGEPARDGASAELDRVLAKVHATGRDSLTPAEARTLDQATQRLREQA
jgi:membrane associated rhomboid family serine protease